MSEINRPIILKRTENTEIPKREDKFKDSILPSVIEYCFESTNDKTSGLVHDNLTKYQSQIEGTISFKPESPSIIEDDWLHQIPPTFLYNATIKLPNEPLKYDIDVGCVAFTKNTHDHEYRNISGHWKYFQTVIYRQNLILDGSGKTDIFYDEKSFKKLNAGQRPTIPIDVSLRDTPDSHTYINAHGDSLQEVTRNQQFYVFLILRVREPIKNNIKSKYKFFVLHSSKWFLYYHCQINILNNQIMEDYHNYGIIPNELSTFPEDALNFPVANESQFYFYKNKSNGAIIEMQIPIHKPTDIPTDEFERQLRIPLMKNDDGQDHCNDKLRDDKDSKDNSKFYNDKRIAVKTKEIQDMDDGGKNQIFDKSQKDETSSVWNTIRAICPAHCCMPK